MKLEERFLSVGTTMASGLDGAEALILSLDTLSRALEGDASAKAIAALEDAAEGLLRLPPVQTERRAAVESLVRRSGELSVHIEELNTLLVYLRNLAMSLKIIAATAPEFAGFAQEVIDRIAIGAETLDQFDAKLGVLDKKLRRALGFVQELDTDCELVIPSLASDLRANAQAIQRHNQDIGAIAVRVAQIVVRIKTKVGAALIAMQIGDNTRQRIEHVQYGLRLLERDTVLDDPDLRMRQGSANTLRRVLLAQITDLHEAFVAGAQTVTDNLLGLSGDVGEVLRVKAPIGEGQSAGFLRELERKIVAARGLVDKVRAADIQNGEAGREVVGAVDALLANVAAVQSVKQDVRYMSINTSLRCKRMGDAGRPMNAVSMELRVSADKLGDGADGATRDLGLLATDARHLLDDEGDADLGVELGRASQSIHMAADKSDAALFVAARRSTEVAEAMEHLSADAYFHNDLGLALVEAREALREITDEYADPDGAADPALDAALKEVFALYTMTREREIHQRLAPTGAAAPIPSARAPAQDDESLFDDALF